MSTRTSLTWANVALRGLLEAGLVVALAVAGWAAAGDQPWLRPLLAVLVPAAGFGFWGAVDFRQAGRHAPALRMAQELLVAWAAAAATYAAGHRTSALLLAVAVVAHHVLRLALSRGTRPAPAPPGGIPRRAA